MGLSSLSFCPVRRPLPIFCILFSKLSWHWSLAQDDVEQIARRTNFRPMNSEHISYNGKNALDNIDLGYSGTGTRQP